MQRPLLFLSKTGFIICSGLQLCKIRNPTLNGAAAGSGFEKNPYGIGAAADLNFERNPYDIGAAYN